MKGSLTLPPAIVGKVVLGHAEAVVPSMAALMKQIADVLKRLRRLERSRRRDRKEEVGRDTKEATQQIMRAVCEEFGLPIGVMVSPRRGEPAVRARMTAMALTRELTDQSLALIGAQFGGRDHGTVIHAVKTVQNDCDLDPAFKARVEIVRTKCREALGRA